MTDLAGERELRAGKIRRKIIKRPGVVGLKPQFGADVVERENVRRRDRPGELALMQAEAVHLQLPPQQRGEVELQLDFRERERRAAGGLRVAEPDVFRDDAVSEPQPHPGEFQVDAAFAQRGDQARL